MTAVELLFAAATAMVSPIGHDTVPQADAHRLVHDSAGGRLLMFSGLRAGATGAARYRTSLFSHGQGAWTQVADGGPWGRDDAQVVYDTRRNRVVLHGGRQIMADRSVRLLTDTWEWDGTSWSKVDSVGPAGRMHAGMAYDARRGVTVLFGGFGANDSLLSDTWEWNGSSWKRAASTGPAGRWVNGMTWDPVTRSVLLHVADKAKYDRTADVAHAELYQWNGTAWVSMGDAPRLSPQQPVVATRRGLVWFNGWQKDTPSETWIRTGARWVRIEGAQPTRRRGAAVAYDTVRDVVVLIGGEDDTGPLRDRWEFDGARWEQK